MQLPAAEGELAEVLVVRHQQPALSCRARQDRGVRRLRHCLGYRQHVVAAAAQVRHDGRTGRLVHQDPHGKRRLRGHRRGEDLFLGKHAGSVRQRRPYVLGLESRVFGSDVLLGHALREHADDELDRDPRATDDRLASHDCGV